MRIDKFLANKAVGSRKEVHELIKRGYVTVNSDIIKQKDAHIDEHSDCIAVNGEIISNKQKYYIKFNKPAGYVTAVEDSKAPVVMDVLPPEFIKMGVFPVGRLDKDTEGLLLLTNDGVWAHRVINGKKEVPKCYEFTYEGELANDASAQINAGIVLEDGTHCKPGILELLDNQKGLLTITEGKFHQVKRMIAAVGGKITYLKRLSIHNINLSNIEKVKEFTDLTAEEIGYF